MCIEVASKQRVTGVFLPAGFWCSRLNEKLIKIRLSVGLSSQEDKSLE